jgi:hypothetical protein
VYQQTDPRTGKTRVLAAIARAWDGPVFGTATSQNATNELHAAGVQIAANTTRLLTAIQRRRIPPGSLIVADEGSMISITHLAVLIEYAARNRCKLILVGDQEQLAAVEGGGAMTLLADRLGYVLLAEPVRFTAAREREASPRVDPLLPRPQGLWAERVPHQPDLEHRAYLAEIAALMDDRKQRLGQHAAQTTPAWAITALGPVPEDPAARQDWERNASSIAASREMYGYDHPGDPIGPEPTLDTPDQRAAWHEAFLVLSQASGPDVRAMRDGRLWLIRDTYAAETAWAPRHVGLDAIRTAAEADAARKDGDHDRAARHETLAASYRALRDHYQQREQALYHAMVGRQEWEQATADSRLLAIAADAELRRRYPGQGLEPLRSAEPAHASDIEREHPHPASDGKPAEIASWICDPPMQHQVSRAGIDERPQLMVPGEDPVRGDLGKTFPGWPASGRDAILQPPKPEIIPSARILQLAAEHDTEPDREAAD